MIMPKSAAMAIIIGSCSFFIFQIANDEATAIRMVGISNRFLLANTITAPAMAPMAAAVTPSMNALMAGFLLYFLK